MYNSSKKSISKIISIFLISSLLICACSTISFATGTDGWDSSEFRIVVDRTYQDNTSVDITNSCSITHNATLAGVTCTKITPPAGSFKEDVLLAYKYRALKNTEYNFKASFFFNYSRNASIVVLLRIRVNGAIYRTQTLYSAEQLADTNNSWCHLDFNFTPDVSDITSGYECEFLVRIESNSAFSGSFGIANDIYLQALNDNTAILGSILNWLSNIYNSVSSVASSVVSGVSNSLSNLGNNISTWLTTVKDGIVNKLQNVQTAITNAIDGIQQWFVNLGNRIGEFFTMLKNYILYFQHPVTLNSDGVPVDSNGNPVYTNPFEDTLQSVSDTLDDWFDSLDDFILTIQSVNVQITGYLQTFTNIFNRFNAGVPIIGVIITLALIVIVIKKIMGR